MTKSCYGNSDKRSFLSQVGWTGDLKSVFRTLRSGTVSLRSDMKDVYECQCTGPCPKGIHIDSTLVRVSLVSSVTWRGKRSINIEGKSMSYKGQT